MCGLKEKVQKVFGTKKQFSCCKGTRFIGMERKSMWTFFVFGLLSNVTYWRSILGLNNNASLSQDLKSNEL